MRWRRRRCRRQRTPQANFPAANLTERKHCKMCTLEKRGRVFVLTLTGADEHRLNPSLLSAIRSALARVRSSVAASGQPAALVTAAEGKFFSNGLDLDWAKMSPLDRPQLMGSALQRVLHDLLSLPMPTIAAVTGHVVAGGVAFALVHDYVVMRADRGFFYMSELNIGVPFTESVMALMRTKIPDPRARRDVLLRAERMTAAASVQVGIVDRAVNGSSEAVVEAAVGMAEELAAKNWDGEVYASIRKGTYEAAFLAIGPGPAMDEEDDEKKATSKL